MRRSKPTTRPALMLGVLALLWSSPVPAEEASALDRVLDAIVTREQALDEQMRRYGPLVETYLQTLEPDANLGVVPQTDHYFLGRLDLSGGAGSPAASVRARSFRSSWRRPSTTHRMPSRGWSEAPTTT